MAVFWNKMFLTIIVLLIVLFLDAVREIRKYSSVHVNEKAANVNSSAFDHIQMKLFRSQRNLYLSGFSLFLWLVLRRTVTLLTQLAKEMASHAALETQVNDATEAAKKYMAENERLQEVPLSFISNFLMQQVVNTMYSEDGLLRNACPFFSFWLKKEEKYFYSM